ncbi:hypothetical protein B7494_g890 [Chlorociboria aeruginascens]|nr:hypothetical protein B7494_g890 [Chlorociboria aeruginascens]
MQWPVPCHYEGPPIAWSLLRNPTLGAYKTISIADVVSSLTAINPLQQSQPQQPPLSQSGFTNPARWTSRSSEKRLLSAFDAVPTNSGATGICPGVVDAPRVADGQRQVLALEQHRLLSLGNELLLERGLTATQVIDNYSGKVHEWFPVVGLTKLREDVTLLASFEALDTDDDPVRPMQLYLTLKKVVPGLQLSSQGLNQRLVQLQALIALYECTKGRYYQAGLTLSSVIAMMDLKRLMEMEQQTSLQMCLCLVVLDRILVLASIDHDVPILCSSSSAICKVIQLYLGQSQAPNGLAMVTGPTHAIYVMSNVALAAGRVLHFVSCSNNALRSEETYECLESCMHDMTKSLIEARGSHSLVYCDAISLSLCCLVILHLTRTNQPSAMGYVYVFFGGFDDYRHLPSLIFQHILPTTGGVRYAKHLARTGSSRRREGTTQQTTATFEKMANRRQVKVLPPSAI